MYKLKFLIIMSISFLVACKEQPANNDGLKTVSDFPIGTAVIIDKLLKDSKLQNLQISNFNSITSASDMKMRRILPKEGEYNWATADTILSYATRHNQRFFGHNLIWHSSTPKWVVEKAKQDSLWLEGFLKEYIQTYVGRYKGKVAGWDVINEGLETAGGAFRKTIWYNTLGEDYIAKAFQYAHEADPDAVLFYNDFNIERDTLKLNAMLKMIDKLKADHVPISGIGFQMHIRMDIPDEVIAHALKKAADTGLQIHLSEVDIIFNSHDDTRGGGVEKYTVLTEGMKQAQAEKYEALIRMYKTIVPKAQQFGITFWGFTDRDTWIRSFFNMKDWPTVFDDDLNPKPAYHRMKYSLSN